MPSYWAQCAAWVGMWRDHSAQSNQKATGFRCGDDQVGAACTGIFADDTVTGSSAAFGR